jgi:hypothetical protein
VPRLADELRRRGMEVRVNMDTAHSPDMADVRQLAGGGILSRGAEAPPKGSVYVVCDGLDHQAAPPPAFRDAPEVGRLGPFHFFGDRAVGDAIRAALR